VKDDFSRKWLLGDDDDEHGDDDAQLDAESDFSQEFTCETCWWWLLLLLLLL
jgi:hypothetical protein